MFCFFITLYICFINRQPSKILLVPRVYRRKYIINIDKTLRKCWENKMNSYFLLTQLESLLESPRFRKQFINKANDDRLKHTVRVNVTVVLGRHFNIYCQNLPTDNIMCFVQNSGLILGWLVDIATHEQLSYCVIQRCKLTSPINHDLTKCKRFASAILCDLQN